jgi:hypothetical protein
MTSFNISMKILFDRHHAIVRSARSTCTSHDQAITGQAFTGKAA